MDKITEILKEMHEMQDEPVRMNEGGTVLTPEDYQSKYVDFYAPFTIDVQQAPELEDEDEDQEPIRPDILTPVGQRDDAAPDIFRQVSTQGGQAYDVDDIDPTDYIANFGKDITTYTTDAGGFKEYLSRSAKFIQERNMEVPGVVTMATGLPIGAMAYGAAELNRKQQLKNATDISAAGGRAGSMFTLNGQTVSRAPGSTRFDGTIVGMSNDQLYRLDEIRNKFIPGTMQEIFDADPLRKGYTRTGKGALSTAGDVAIDAFGTVHGAGGSQMVGALQAERAREQMFRDAMSSAGVSLAGVNVSRDALAMKQALDAQMSGKKSFFTTTARMSDADYNAALSDSQKFIRDYIAKNHAKPEPDKPEVSTDITDTSSIAGVSEASGGDDSDSGGSSSSGGSYFSDIGGGSSAREDAESDAAGGGGPPRGSSAFDKQVESRMSDRGRFAASGGRIGMQAGGVAQQPQPAGFVGGPPENFTDGQTVADDQPMSVPEGTFVINAAAVEFAGSDDIKTMLSKAYGKMQKKVDKTIGVAKIPTEDEIDVAVSRGEVIVPPEVAKIIGYDRLEKINNRGKKEVSRRQEAAGGGFLTEKKFANGGEVEYEDRIIVDEVRRKMKTLLESLPEDVRVTSKYFADDRPARQEYHEELARLNEVKPMEGRFHSSGRHKRVNVPQTPTLLNLYIMAEEVAHQLGGYGTQPPSPKELLFGLSKEQKIKKAESRYAEELRAKKIAFDAVGGLFPTDKKTVDLYEDDYGRSFASFVLKAGSPELLAQMAEKYPKLKNQINTDGTVKERHTKPSQDFKLAVDAEEAGIYDEFKKSTFFQRMNPLVDPPIYVEGYSGADGKPVGSKMAGGGEVPKVLPEPSPVRQKKVAARQEAERMADTELRADLEEFIRDDQLARLGWDLYTSGELQLLGIPTPFDYTKVTKGEGEDARETVRDEMAYTYAGSYYPAVDQATSPAFPFEKDGPRVKVRSSRYPSTAVREYLDKVGGTYSEETPIVQYFAEPMYITKRNRTDPERYMGDRASVMLTLAHELRHAALTHLAYEYDAPEMTVGGEERLMDYFDQKGREQASKNNALVLAKSPYISVAQRGKSAVELTIYKKEAELYNSLAAEVLKVRGVPPVAQPEEKGFISKFIDGLFREPHPATGKVKKGDGKPVDYESEAMQSAQF